MYNYPNKLDFRALMKGNFMCLGYSYMGINKRLLGEFEAWRSGGGLGSYYSKLEMPALLLCSVKIVIYALHYITKYSVWHILFHLPKLL